MWLWFLYAYKYSLITGGKKVRVTIVLLPQEEPSAKFKTLQISINTHHKSPNEVSAWWTKWRWLTSLQHSLTVEEAAYTNELNESQCDPALTSVFIWGPGQPSVPFWVAWAAAGMLH